jgi:hypothetical protein
MFAWLQSHRAELRNADDVEALMKPLHAKLHEGSGDDDMSLVWVYPTKRSGSASGANDRASDALEESDDVN